VYGPAKTSTPITEDCQTNPISPYGITKLSIEKYCDMYSRLFDIPVVIARPSNPYGPNQIPYCGQGFVATAAAMIMRGEVLTIFGQFGTVRDYLYIDDLCAALKLLLTSDVPSGSIFNVGSEMGMNNIEVLNEIAKVYGIRELDIRINFLPARAFDVPYNVLSNARLKALGWSVNTSFEKGVEKTIHWIAKYLGKI